jgi:hypothetical protein
LEFSVEATLKMEIDSYVDQNVEATLAADNTKWEATNCPYNLEHKTLEATLNVEVVTTALNSNS